LHLPDQRYDVEHHLLVHDARRPVHLHAERQVPRADAGSVRCNSAAKKTKCIEATLLDIIVVFYYRCYF
jgi:hypothetical protein